MLQGLTPLLITILVMIGLSGPHKKTLSHLKHGSYYLASNLCNSIITWTDLIVHLQRVSLSFGLEVLCVGVHCEVNVLVEALYVDRVPVLVIQQTAHSDSNTAAAEPRPAVVCRNTKKTTRTLWAAFTSSTVRLWMCGGREAELKKPIKTHKYV